MTEIEETTNIEATSTAQADAMDGVFKEVDGVLVPDYDATMTLFTEGDIVSGKVVRIDKDEVLVDIGYKSEGVIPQNELSIRKSVNPADEVEMGEEIDALVMQKEDADGRLILSKKRARFEKAWKRIEGAFESGTPVTGTVIEVVKGGLILDLGVRGFLPASLVDIRRVQDLGEYVGKELLCRVIEMNRNRNNVVLSRRAVLEEERREVRQQIIDDLQVGQVVEGTISNIVDFGAFVDLDGIDGLIHISELSWTHINHPSEVLQVNQKVKVKVLDIDRDRQRISLGLKQTQEDPWTRIVSEHRVGDVVEGRVTKLVAFGAFVEIYAGIEGLVHISELANRHVERPDEVVQVNQPVAVKIIEIDSDRRRLSLSIKRVDGQPLPKHDEAEAEGAVEAAEDELVEAAVAEAIVEEAVEEAIVDEIVAEAASAEAVEAVEEAIIAEVVAEAAAEEAVEAVEEAVIAEVVAEAAVAEAVAAEQAAEETGDQEAVEEAIVAEAVAEEAVEEAVVAEIVAEAAVEEAVVAEIVAEAAVEEAVVAEAVAEEAIEEAVVAEAVAEEAIEEAVVAEAVAEVVVEEAEAAIMDEPTPELGLSDDVFPVGGQTEDGQTVEGEKA
jgi:small subunit ribosomal protein S1